MKNPIKNKQIFITGGAGFIANTIINQLIEHNIIIAYDNFLRDTLSSSSVANHPNLKVIKGDVLDFDALYKAMQGSDIVVHCAAIAGIDSVIQHPTATMRTNIMGTANVLESAKLLPVRDRVMIFSTSEIFGSYAYRVAEDSPSVTASAGEARWSYSVSKLAGEHLAAAYFREFKLPIVSVRPFNVYGPGQTGEGAMQIFIKRALKNENIEIYGDGSRLRAWCFVDDFVDGILSCLSEKIAIGESYNLGNHRAVITVYGLAQTICRVLNSSSKIIFKQDLSADIDLRIPSIAKAAQDLGFAPKVDLEDGILRTAEWMTSLTRPAKRAV